MCKIPLDLVMEIHMRLPAKSLMRFKCVSKQWSSFITCRYFSNRFFTATRQQPRLYMPLMDKDRQCILLTITSTYTDNNNNTCFVVNQDLTIPFLPGIRGHFLNSVRGLMCFSYGEKACIYNPTTRQLLITPAVKTDIIAEQDQRKSSQYYIGYDPINDQYKILCTISMFSGLLSPIKSEHWVFVLEAGGSWEKVVLLLENYHPHVPSPLGRSISTGTVVNYMAWLNNHSCAVVSFDFRSEELTTIPVHREVESVSDTFGLVLKMNIIEYGGKMAVFDQSSLVNEGLVNLWIQDNAVKKGWSKKTLVLQPSQQHLVDDMGKLMVKGTTQDGKVILAQSLMRSPFYILCYDTRSNDLRKVEIKGVPQDWFDKECFFNFRLMDESESIIHFDF